MSDPNADIPILIRTRQSGFFQPRENVHEFFRLELDVSRLNKVHKHLWLAGLPTGPRPLRRQKLLDRKIFVTEQADLHLIWYQDRIFIKPLPPFLLRRTTWTDHLCQCPEMYGDACGFLLSYTCLICHRSDFRIAQELGLVPSEIAWEHWTAFMADVLSHIDPSEPEKVSERYRTENFGCPGSIGSTASLPDGPMCGFSSVAIIKGRVGTVFS